MYKFKLPVNEDYFEFVIKNKHLKNKSAVYKLTFNDGLFYIGMTNNFAGRIYNHISMTDSKNAKKLTKKHERMFKAINNSESVIFDVVSEDTKLERSIISESKNDNKCLNMANGSSH